MKAGEFLSKEDLDAILGTGEIGELGRDHFEVLYDFMETEEKVTTIKLRNGIPWQIGQPLSPFLNEPDKFTDLAQRLIPPALEQCHASFAATPTTIRFVPKLSEDLSAGEGQLLARWDRFALGETPYSWIRASEEDLIDTWLPYPETHWSITAAGAILVAIFGTDNSFTGNGKKPEDRSTELMKRQLGGEYRIAQGAFVLKQSIRNEDYEKRIRDHGDKLRMRMLRESMRRDIYRSRN